jgi:hypothetical protein
LRTLPSLKYSILFFWVVGVSACAQLPEYARPQTIKIDGIQEAGETGFTYRTLTTSDFRAPSLPDRQSAHAKSINAQSAILIHLTPDSNFKIKPWPLWGQMNYLGSVNRLAFEAVMIPRHSWWNPNMNPARKTYVLQHEQIHFALTELAARQLTRDSQEWASKLLVVKQTPEQVRSEIFEQIQEKIKTALEANQKRHLEFDNDTSLHYNPSWQAWWFEKVEKELRETALDQKEGVEGAKLPGNR